MIHGGRCPPSEPFESPAGDGGLIKMGKPLLPKHEGVSNTEDAKSGCLGGSAMPPGISFASPTTDELPWRHSGLPVCF
jgi:hypothetical protein